MTPWSWLSGGSAGEGEGFPNKEVDRVHWPPSPAPGSDEVSGGPDASTAGPEAPDPGAVRPWLVVGLGAIVGVGIGLFVLRSPRR